MQQLERPQRAANARKERMVSGDLFEEEEADMPDQAGAPMARPSAKSVPKGASMSPRKRSEAALNQLKVQMMNCGVRASAVFSLADKMNRGMAKRDEIKAAFAKIGGQLKRDLISEAMLFFGTNNVDVNQKVFLAAFDAQPQGRSQSPNKRPTSAQPAPQLDNDVKDSVVRKIAIMFK